jgi:uncharacterized membrane protein YgcG
MLRKMILANCAVAALGVVAPTVASARGGGHGGGGGGHGSFHGGGGFHGGGFHGEPITATMTTDATWCGSP